jgi:urease beta subunit
MFQAVEVIEYERHKHVLKASDMAAKNVSTMSLSAAYRFSKLTWSRGGEALTQVGIHFHQLLLEASICYDHYQSSGDSFASDSGILCTEPPARRHVSLSGDLFRPTAGSRNT